MTCGEIRKIRQWRVGRGRAIVHWFWF